MLEILEDLRIARELAVGPDAEAEELLRGLRLAGRRLAWRLRLRLRGRLPGAEGHFGRQRQKNRGQEEWKATAHGSSLSDGFYAAPYGQTIR